MDIKFAYWIPNVSGGLVVSKIPQRTDWTFDYNAKLAQTAEEVGFDYALAQARFIASYGAEYQLEALTTVAALAPVTQKLKLIAPIVRTKQTPTKLNTEQLMVLKHIVETTNDATLEELRHQLQQQTGVLIGRSTVDRMLTRLNLTVKKNTAPNRKRE
jgi:hypothetical protein